MEKVRIGVIGCGAISGAYLKMAANFPFVDMCACADINPEAAAKKASEFSISRSCSVEQLLADKSIEVVLNLTVPKAHVPIGIAALEAGKHVYSEKPLGIDREDARKLVELAKKKNLRVGCAPDTFMGAGIQTSRKIIDDGTIGRPVAFTAFMLSPGPEWWHPSPEFYYEVGGGPMLDMGPYYLTALLNFFGPIKRISGFTSKAITDRTITSQPKYGKKISVETEDHIAGLIEFENGCMGTIVTSFATRFGQYNRDQPITVYGSEGTLCVPDPNVFDGQVSMQLKEQKEMSPVPHTFVPGYGRSIGLADMAKAIRTNRPHRCSAELSFAVLDAMQGFFDSSRSGCAFTPTAKFTRPAAMPASLPFGVLD